MKPENPLFECRSEPLLSTSVPRRSTWEHRYGRQGRSIVTMLCGRTRGGFALDPPGLSPCASA